MAVRKLGPGDFRVMPWKNGAGSTTELAIEPPGATLAGGFLWRVSMATVAESGPFSSFPGFDRTLLLLEGQGLELDYGAHGRALLPGPLEPARFRGEWATRGRLLGGPCRDFNVMSRRGAIEHEVNIIYPGPEPSGLPEAPTVLVFCCAGTAGVTGLADGLRAGELLRIDGGGGSGIMVRAGHGAAPLAVVALRPARSPAFQHK